ncbi:MAG: H-NS histone family protein [Acinetobacter sp.]|uniref:H-NS histone family protein n=1 Tax=Acinetobacter sp. TaxID=472 RepID=UPI0026378CB7|nr:H-NS histone family protein [Acinetobacter sp.]MDD2944358.1 H-NS histone family protein [Acinetobacter sp.]
MNTANRSKKTQSSLENLSMPQILQVLQDANAVLESRKEVDRNEAKLQILKLVNHYQIPFDELTDLLKSSDAIYGTHGRVKKIYLDNKNKQNKPWGGVGRPPNWIRKALADGIDIEQYAIETTDDSQHTSTWFFNPARPTQRWNGIGCKPIWFKELEAQNVDMNQYMTVL